MKIIGVGNERRGDDAIGVQIARKIQSHELPGVSVEILKGDGSQLLELWKGCEHVVLVDCAYSGAQPGTIHRLRVSEKTLPFHLFSSSTHSFGIAEAIELARVLGDLPPVVDVYAIEGDHFFPDSPVCPKVEAAATQVTEEILATLLSLSEI